MNLLSKLFNRSPAYAEITPDKLSQLAPGTRLIDVRQPEEFNGELGHLEGATLVPLATLSQAAQDWDRSAPYLLICRSGGRSSSACGVLTQLGFTQITNLRGGMLAVRAGH